MRRFAGKGDAVYILFILMCVAALVGANLGGLPSPPFSPGPETPHRPLRLGLVGLDSSHVVAFTARFHDPNHPEHVPGARILAGYRGGSPDNEYSARNIDRYTNELKTRWNVPIVDSIAELCRMVDGVLITSVDGRPKLSQAGEVIAAGLPFFLDKPVAGSLQDAIAIAGDAAEAGVPWFGGSSLRWWRGMREAVDPETVGEILGADAYSPSFVEPNHPDLFWYGVHGVESLFTAMGRGCVSVTRVFTEDTDLVVGLWKDGRVGTFRGTRAGATGYGATVFGTQSITQATGHDYRGLLEAIVEFFTTLQAPIDPLETLEIMAFMEAADESRRRGGATVELPELSVNLEDAAASSDP